MFVLSGRIEKQALAELGDSFNSNPTSPTLFRFERRWRGRSRCRGFFRALEAKGVKLKMDSIYLRMDGKRKRLRGGIDEQRTRLPFSQVLTRSVALRNAVDALRVDWPRQLRPGGRDGNT